MEYFVRHTRVARQLFSAHSLLLSKFFFHTCIFTARRSWDLNQRSFSTPSSTIDFIEFPKAPFDTKLVTGPLCPYRMSVLEYLLKNWQPSLRTASEKYSMKREKALCRTIRLIKVLTKCSQRSHEIESLSHVYQSLFEYRLRNWDSTSNKLLSFLWSLTSIS